MRTASISFTTFDELLKGDVRHLEQGVVDILISMRYQKQMSFSAHNMLLCALKSIYKIANIIYKGSQILYNIA